MVDKFIKSHDRRMRTPVNRLSNQNRTPPDIKCRLTVFIAMTPKHAIKRATCREIRQPAVPDFLLAEQSTGTVEFSEQPRSRIRWSKPVRTVS